MLTSGGERAVQAGMVGVHRQALTHAYANALYAFISFFSSFKKRKSVPSARIFFEFDLIIPASCKRSA